MRIAAHDLGTNSFHLLVADVHVVPPGETRKSAAILVTIEHADADPVDVVLPYSKPRFRRSVEYGEQFAEPGARKIFVP